MYPTQHQVNDYIVPTPWPSVNEELAGGLPRGRSSLLASPEPATLAAIDRAFRAQPYRVVGVSFSPFKVPGYWFPGPWMTARKIQDALRIPCDLLVIEGLEWLNSRAWQRAHVGGDACRIVNAFGLVGTNAHVLVLWRGPPHDLFINRFDYRWTAQASAGATRLLLEQIPEGWSNKAELTNKTFWV